MNEQENNFTQEELEVLQHDVELGEALGRLYKNRDFKKLIVGLYMEDGEKFLIRNLPVAKDRTSIVEQMLSRGWFFRFLKDIEDSANSALAEFNKGE